jgi:hypothetical protein
VHTLFRDLADYVTTRSNTDNAAAKPHHSNDQGSRELRKWRDETGAEISKISAANRKFWRQKEI